MQVETASAETAGFASDMTADIAVLAAVLTEQLSIASAETERWFLILFECLTAIEARAGELQACVSPAGEAVASDHIAAIHSLLGNAYEGLQVQDLLRQQLEAVSKALVALEGQCRRLSCRRELPEVKADSFGRPAVGAILAHLEKTYVTQTQRVAHARVIAQHTQHPQRDDDLTSPAS